MSSKGIYTALSGAIAQNQRLDTIANNIANSNSTAFKADKQTFREYLTAYEKQPDVIQVPKVPASVESFYDMQGGDKGYVDASGTYTNFEQGQLKPTGNKLDFSLEGSGFFEVLTPQGVRMTRNGAFRTDGEGRLVNASGFPVLKKGTAASGPGADPRSRMITLNNKDVTVTRSGEIYQGGDLKGNVSVVDVENKDALLKVGRSEYKLKDGYEVNVKASRSSVHQGFLEGSNVNIIKEMTDMISTTRAFESTQKLIKAYDEMNAKLVNDVPRMR